MFMGRSLVPQHFFMLLVFLWAQPHTPALEKGADIDFNLKVGILWKLSPQPNFSREGPATGCEHNGSNG